MQNYLSEALPAARGMYADQKLEQKYFGVEMNLEREQLYREDVRDLMELTVGRMDVYLTAGTLMLTFSISWFTDADILDDAYAVPDWFRTLFLVSNFSAVGYLVLSVWLAMHASVAAHSVGVRLLTSFTRLTIPSREEIQKFRMALMPQLNEFLSLGRAVRSLGKQKIHQARGLLGRSSASRAAAAQSEVTVDGNESANPGQAAATLFPVIAEELGLAANRPGATTTGGGDLKHIQRFKDEQKMWLGYDAYSRVCMCLGMNQLLQALSYYVVGVLTHGHLISGIAAFFGIKLLSLLLLRLDIMGMCDSWKEYGIVASFIVVPTTLAAAAFLSKDDSLALDIAVTPCFILHGMWLLYIVFDLDPGAARCGLGRSEGLPLRIRTVNYLDVCSESQRVLVQDVQKKEAESLIVPLLAAQDDLAVRLKQAMEHERSGGSTGQVQSGDSDLHKASARLAEELERGRNSGAAATTDLAQNAFADAERALSRYDVWEKAPELFASLKALREQSVAEHFTDEQKHIIEQSYQEFLQRCRDLELPIVSDDPSRPSKLSRSEVDEAEDPPWSGYLPSSIYGDARNSSVAVMTSDSNAGTPSFKTRVDSLAQRPSSSSDREQSVVPSAHQNGQTGDATPVVDRPEEDPSTTQLIPSNAVPDEKFPSKVVRRFTLWTMAWWFVSAGLHLARAHPSTRVTAPQVLVRLGAADLDHAAFFEVTSLNCNGSHVLLADHFSWWIAEKRPHSELKFVDHMHSGVATQLSWIRQQRTSSAVPFHVPGSWKMVTAAWEACAGLECNKARVAGWDGSSAVVATAYIDTGSGDAWRVRPEFRVHPRLGHRTGTSRSNSFLRSSFTSRGGASHGYHDIRAMHLSPGGEVLTILFRGSSSSPLLLDIWNLSEGTLVGTWSLDSHRYAGVCHDGQQFLLVQKGKAGPVVHALKLPLPVHQQLTRTPGKASGFLEA